MTSSRVNTIGVLVAACWLGSHENAGAQRASGVGQGAQTPNVGAGHAPPLHAAQAAQTASQTPAFKTSIEIVRIDALVMSDGKPIAGLTASDFEVVDNGVPQTLDAVAHEQIPLNVTLALDVSRSVEGHALQRLRDAAAGLLQGLGAHDRATLLTFSHTVRRLAPLGDPRSVREALSALRTGGPTALHDALFSTFVLSRGGDSRWLALVFTDGMDTASWLTSEQVITAAKRTDAVVYAVAAGEAAKLPLWVQARNGPLLPRAPTVLESVVDVTGGGMVLADPRRVQEAFLKVLAEFKDRYVLTYAPRDVAPLGWHEVGVKVKTHPKAAIKARRGYYASPPQPPPS